MAKAATTTTPSRRLFLAAGSAAVVFSSLKLAVAQSHNVVDAYISEMRAAGFELAAWNGKYTVTFPDGLEFDQDAWGRIGEKYAVERRADPNFHNKVALAISAELLP